MSEPMRQDYFFEVSVQPFCSEHGPIYPVHTWTGRVSHDDLLDGAVNRHARELVLELIDDPKRGEVCLRYLGKQQPENEH